MKDKRHHFTVKGQERFAVNPCCAELKRYGCWLWRSTVLYPEGNCWSICKVTSFMAEFHNQWPVEAISHGAVPFLQKCLRLPCLSSTKIILYPGMLIMRFFFYHFIHHKKMRTTGVHQQTSDAPSPYATLVWPYPDPTQKVPPRRYSPPSTAPITSTLTFPWRTIWKGAGPAIAV